MSRLLAVLADRARPFSRCLRAVRESSPSFSEDRFETTTAAVCAPDGTWDVVGDATSMASTPPGVALVAHVRARFQEGAPRPRRASLTGLVRADGWAFAHDGSIEDFACLVSRTSPRRRASFTHDGDGALLLAYLLTRLDERGTPRGESIDATDEAVAAGASELGRRIGSVSFVLSNGSLLYAYRFDRGLHLLERSAGEHRDDRAVLVASEPLSNEPWAQLGSPTLVSGRRCRGGLEVRFLSGADPRPSKSERELPFTD